MKIIPISRAGGAEISGVDLATKLTAEEVSEIRQAFLEFGVIVFRDQNLSDADQLRFCECMGGVARRGKPLERRRRDRDSAYGGSVHMVTNAVKDGTPLGSFGDGEVWFHHDGSFKEIPYAATVLYSLEIPSTGGETVFANMYAAYDKLPQPTKDRLEGLHALNVYDYARTGRVDLSLDIATMNHWVHPVVIRHPDTRRPALYVSPLITARIEGMGPDDSDALLEELFRFAEDDDLVFEHAWRVGDLVMMDNRCITHARKDFPANEPRTLRRTMVEGVPIATRGTA